MSRTLLSAWHQTLHRNGGKLAVVEASGGRTATFRELDEGASKWIAAHAPEASACRGRAVVFARPNGIAWLEIFLGLAKIGAIAVPLDAAEPTSVQLKIARSLRAAIWNGTTLSGLQEARRYRNPALCFIKLTSGTTGEPRPLRFTAAQLLADGVQVTATMGIRKRDLNYALIPFGHSCGLGNLTMPLLAQGIPLVCGSAPLPHAIAEDFARWRPTVFPGVPAMWRALAASSISLDSLRLAISAGASLPPSVAQEFSTRFGRRLHNFYGSSETGGIAYDRAGRATLTGGVGRPLRGVTTRILSGSRLEIRSAAVFTVGNRRRQRTHGAWVVADRVSINSKGEFTLLSRRGQTVKIAGRRVNLMEVSNRLRQIQGVGEVWVGISTSSDPVLGAVVVTTKTAAELRTEMHADTAAWKIPKKLHLVAALPLTQRGKIDTRAVQALIG